MKEKSIGIRLRMLLSVIIILMSAAFVISNFYIIRRDELVSAVNESGNLLNTFSGAIEADIDKYKELSRLIMMNDKLVTFLRADGDEVNAGMVNDARYGIEEILNVTENVDSVYVFRNDEYYLASKRDNFHLSETASSDHSWMENILEKKGRAVVFINGDDAVYKNDGNPFISICRAVYDIQSQKQTGVMMMCISKTLFEETMNMHTNKEICIMGIDGTFLAGNRELTRYFSDDLISDELMYKEVKNEDGRFVVLGMVVSDMPIFIMHVNRLGGGPLPLETLVVFSLPLLVSIISVLLAMSFISRNITAPIARLSRDIEKNKGSGDFEIIRADVPDNEIGMLKDSFNGMISHNNDLMKRLLIDEQNMQKAELQVLYEQIKPHFLYNSIETIGSMAMEDKAEDVYSALETLGSFYRNFLSEGSKEIPLSREINIVKDYLSLQKLRYGNMINDEYDIAEDTKEHIVPKLILQPLVENSIYHGIRLKGEEGTIRIKSRLINGELHIYVRDTGVGMDKDKIRAILSENDEEHVSKDENSESFGLWDTLERIRYYCGRRDIVRIDSEPGEFTEIELIIV